MANRRRRRNMDGDIEDEIRAKIYLGWSGPQIHRHIKDKWKGRDLPDLRTIQRMIRDISIIDKSSEWSMADSEPEDARLLLDVFADGCAKGYLFPLSKDLAKWVIRVKKIALDAPAQIVFFLAFLYLTRDDTGVEIKGLDGYLAFTPWKEDRKYVRLYKRAVAKEWVPKVEMWSILVNELFKTGLFDPRFTGSAEAIIAFEKDVYERSKRGGDLDLIADMYNIHPDDINDIVKKYEKGGAR